MSTVAAWITPESHTHQTGLCLFDPLSKQQTWSCFTFLPCVSSHCPLLLAYSLCRAQRINLCIMEKSCLCQCVYKCLTVLCATPTICCAGLLVPCHEHTPTCLSDFTLTNQLQKMKQFRKQQNNKHPVCIRQPSEDIAFSVTESLSDKDFFLSFGVFFVIIIKCFKINKKLNQ